MKHVFTVHSTITFLVSYAVIKHEEIAREDVIFISHGYSVPLSGFKVFPSFQSKRSNLIGINIPKSYDRYISKITNDEKFIAYIDLMAYYQKILVTHPKCQLFHFIEEGTSAYMVNDDLEDLTWGERKFNYRNENLLSRDTILSMVRVLKGANPRLLGIPYHYMAYANFDRLKYYSFSKNAFFNAPSSKKVLVKLNDRDENVNKLSGLSSPISNALIWIDGSSSKYTGLPETVYNDAVNEAIKLLIDRIQHFDHIYIKLRPGLTNYDSNHLYGALKNQGITVKVLPDNTQLECLFVTAKNCLVVGNLSAALEYAHVYGHQVISIYGLYTQRNPTFFDRLYGFWSNIEVLKK